MLPYPGPIILAENRHSYLTNSIAENRFLNPNVRSPRIALGWRGCSTLKLTLDVLSHPKHLILCDPN